MCTEKTLNNHIKKYMELKQQEKQLHDQIAKESNWLLETFAEMGNEYKNQKVVTSYDKKQFDSKRLEKENVELYNKYLYYSPIVYVNTKALKKLGF